MGRRVDAMGSERRVLVLWAHLPGYLAACLRALLEGHGASVFAIVGRPDPQSRDKELVEYAGFRYLDLSSHETPPERAVRAMIRAYRPEITVAGVGKWGMLARLAGTAKDTGSRVIWAIDHFWRNSWRDYANAVLANLGFIYNRFDAVWVTGARGRQYAQRLGFAGRNILEGVLSCDTGLFRTVGEGRFAANHPRDWPRVFLYVGRYVELKNLDTLVRAYALYRSQVSTPWELWCAGAGPLASALRAQPGVTDFGFQTSEQCAALMGRSGAFVLPSRYEPWGVVLHEATCAGLPVLASDVCGGTSHLVRDGYNGFTFAPRDVGMLAALMRKVSAGGDAAHMGRNSLSISYQFDPQLWADMLLTHMPFCSAAPPVLVNVAEE